MNPKGKHTGKNFAKEPRAGRTAPRAFAVLSLVAVAALVPAAPALAAAADTHDSGSLRQGVNAIHDSGAVGVLAEVNTPRGSRRATAGVADMRTGRPVPADAEFRVGSATKTFVATVLLQLVHEGRLSLADTVDRWLPGVVAGNGNDGSRITVRQLLQHTSGIPDYLRDVPVVASVEGYEANKFRTYQPEELVALAMAYPPVFAPGTSWSYSNTNYVLAGMIINRVTGHTWRQEVNARIIRPLGLAHTSTPTTFPFLAGPHAEGYESFGGATAVDVTVGNPSVADAAGSMISTTDDLNRFFTALVGGKLLPAAQLAEMEKTVPADEVSPGLRYGLGLGWVPLSCGGGYFSHPGDVPGYHTWDGVTADARRSIAISTTGDLDAPQRQAVTTLADQELCAE